MIRYLNFAKRGHDIFDLLWHLHDFNFVHGGWFEGLLGAQELLCTTKLALISILILLYLFDLFKPLLGSQFTFFCTFHDVWLRAQVSRSGVLFAQIAAILAVYFGGVLSK